jgi:hypothetical protein
LYVIFYSKKRVMHHKETKKHLKRTLLGIYSTLLTTELRIKTNPKRHAFFFFVIKTAYFTTHQFR